MHILVMGGTEFVSAALARYLIARGYKVDILTRGVRPVEYEGIGEHLKGERGSIGSLKRAIGDRRYDVLFDISAYTREDVENLCLALNRDHLQSYIFCSSGAVYLPSNKLVSEDYPRGENPHWGEYGLHKAEAEDYLMELYRDEGLPVTIFRPTYIYGPENNIYREAYLFDRVTKGLPVPIPGGEPVGNQFIYIDDLVRTFESAMFAPEVAGSAYNLTHPEIATWQQLLEAIMRVTGREVDVVEIMPEEMRRYGVEPREFFPFRNVNYMLDTERLRETPLAIPATDLTEGLSRTYEWYRTTNLTLHDARMTTVEFVLEKRKDC